MPGVAAGVKWRLSWDLDRTRTRHRPERGGDLTKWSLVDGMLYGLSIEGARRPVGSGLSGPLTIAAVASLVGVI